MNILYCGVGALGSHALFAGRDAQHALAAVDFNRVETKNLESQWFVKQMVGKNKATAMKMQLLNFHGVKLRDYSVRLTEVNVDTILAGQDLIVDCFDNAASRRLVQSSVRERDLPCVHAGLAADAAYGTVRWDGDFNIDVEDTSGQPTCDGAGFLPVILSVSSALAASIQAFLENEKMMNWNVAPDKSEAFAASILS